jgi:hypothetical protein
MRLLDIDAETVRLGAHPDTCEDGYARRALAGLIAFFLGLSGDVLP